LEAVLVVVQPFGGHRVGDLVGDAHIMREILSGEHAHHVVRTAAPVSAEQEV
jgi:hypothetical protein